MEPEVSVPCSHEHSAGVYPDWDESSLYHHILSLYDPFYYYPPIYVCICLVVSFILAFSQKSCMHSSSIPWVPPVRPSYLPWLDHSNYLRRRVQIMKHIITQCSVTATKNSLSVLPSSHETWFIMCCIPLVSVSSEWLALFLSEIPCSNLGPEAGYSDCFFSSLYTAYYVIPVTVPWNVL
jgi:hypothetical protein